MSKKERKENPVMVENKKAKKYNKNIDKQLKSTEEDNLVRNFILIVIVLAVILGIVYFASEAFNKKDDNKTKNEDIAGEINYDILSVGTLLNRPYNEYYVLVYDSTSKDAIKYDTMKSTYDLKSEDKNFIKMYYLDLASSLNKEYYNVGDDNKSNPKAKSISELDFGDLSLLRIKNGKIVEYLEDYKTIQEKLK